MEKAWDLFKRFRKNENVTPESDLIKVMTVSGREFMSMILENKEAVMNSRGWLIACQSGYSRSAELYAFMKQDGVSVVKPSPGEFRIEGGLMILRLINMLATTGKLHDSQVTIDGFDGGFNNLVLFSGNDSRADQSWVNKITTLFQALLTKYRNNRSHLNIYVVEQDEREFGRMIDVIRENQAAGKNPKEIAQLLETSFS